MNIYLVRLLDGGYYLWSYKGEFYWGGRQDASPYNSRESAEWAGRAALSCAKDASDAKFEIIHLIAKEVGQLCCRSFDY